MLKRPGVLGRFNVYARTYQSAPALCAVGSSSHFGKSTYGQEYRFRGWTDFSQPAISVDAPPRKIPIARKDHTCPFEVEVRAKRYFNSTAQFRHLLESIPTLLLDSLRESPFGVTLFTAKVLSNARTASVRLRSKIATRCSTAAFGPAWVVPPCRCRSNTRRCTYSRQPDYDGFWFPFSAPECRAPRRRLDVHELHLQTELAPGARCPKFTGLCLSMSRRSLSWLVAAVLANAGIAAAGAWLKPRIDARLRGPLRSREIAGEPPNTYSSDGGMTMPRYLLVLIAAALVAACGKSPRKQ